MPSSSHPTRLLVTSFYKFTDLSTERDALQAELLELTEVKGLVLLAPEGINGMAAGSASAVAELRQKLAAVPGLESLDYKDSYCDEMPFDRWKVEQKNTLILYKGQFSPAGSHRHLSPQEWHRLLQSDQPITVLDTRNRYETRVGKFKQAIDPEIEAFTEFADYLDHCDLPKDQTTLIYCTGGIRCERAILDMEERGFTNVYQLEGGILRYLEEFPNQEFDGECFVFDKRVAVDQRLEPSTTYWLCPHCGDPGRASTQCRHCRSEARLCDDCLPAKPTCSKDCQNRWERKGRP